MLVATDHDHVANYAPALARLGLADRVRVVQGVEVTGSGPSAAALWTIGHHNAWPIPYQPHAHRHGAPPSQNRAVGALYAELRSAYGARVVQLNHPRPTPKDDRGGRPQPRVLRASGRGAGVRSAAADRRAGERAARAPHRRRRHARARLRRDRGDERRFVGRSISRRARTGMRCCARACGAPRTANSDSHAAVGARSRIRATTSAWAGRRRHRERFDAALRAGRSFGTTGPRVRALRVNGGSLGDLVARRARPRAGRVRGRRRGLGADRRGADPRERRGRARGRASATGALELELDARRIRDARGGRSARRRSRGVDPRAPGPLHRGDRARASSRPRSRIPCSSTWTATAGSTAGAREPNSITSPRTRASASRPSPCSPAPCRRR